MENVQHPDRCAWYLSLIFEWTGRAPVFSRPVRGPVMALVLPYSSQAGVSHDTPTYAFGKTDEAALEALANCLYDDLQADLAVSLYPVLV